MFPDFANFGVGVLYPLPPFPDPDPTSHCPSFPVGEGQVEEEEEKVDDKRTDTKLNTLKGGKSHFIPLSLLPLWNTQGRGIDQGEPA